MKNITDIKGQLESIPKKLKFDEKSHTYKLEGNKLTSVTQYIGKMKPEFPTYQASAAKSRKTGIGAKYYRQIWKLKGAEAIALGSRVHLYAQYGVGIEAPSDGYECSVDEFFKNEVQNKEYISELRVFRGNLAGTIDLIVINDDNTLTLYDFKTNRKTEEELRNTYGKKFKGLDNIGASKMNEFFLQLNLYSWMLQDEFTIRDSYIVHITEDNYELFPNELIKLK